MNRISVYTFGFIAVFAMPAIADFSPFPLKDGKIALDAPINIDTPLKPFVEYQLNACAVVKHTPDVKCVPTANGGFILVPNTPNVLGDNGLMGSVIQYGRSGTGYVVDEGDLINIPPELWKWVREAPRTNSLSSSKAPRIGDNVSNAIIQLKATNDPVVTLPDNTSCNLSEVISIREGSFVRHICP